MRDEYTVTEAELGVTVEPGEDLHRGIKKGLLRYLQDEYGRNGGHINPSFAARKPAHGLYVHQTGVQKVEELASEYFDSLEELADREPQHRNGLIDLTTVEKPETEAATHAVRSILGEEAKLERLNLEPVFSFDGSIAVLGMDDEEAEKHLDSAFESMNQ